MCHGWDSQLAAVGLGSPSLGPIRRRCAQFAVVVQFAVVGLNSPSLAATFSLAPTRRCCVQLAAVGFVDGRYGCDVS